MLARKVTVGLAALCALAGCGADSAEGSRATTVENHANKYTQRQCVADTHTLKTAEEAHVAMSPNGEYADEAELVGEFLSALSPLHEVVADGGSYKIYVTHASCGTPDADGAAPWDAASDVTAPGNF